MQDFLNASELFNLYNVLNALKNDLLWTTNQDDEVEDLERGAAAAAATETEQAQQQQRQLSQVESKTESSSSSSRSSNGGSRSSSSSTTTTGVKGHVRRTSTASMMSTTSVSNMSDSDSDISNEIDSGLESDGNKSDNAQSSDGSDIVDDASCQKSSDKATDLAKRCKRHLNGLYQCLEQMTEAANYLTARYQSDIGPV